MNHLSIQTAINNTLSGFSGIELVDIQYLPKGLLSITIDEPMNPSGVSISHCEQITRQLQAVFFVENIIYDRLEVGSPGINRRLNKLDDFIRFAGYRVTVKLIHAFNNKKTYTGILQLPTAVLIKDSIQYYQVVIENKKISKTQQKKINKALNLNVQEMVLEFNLNETESVRLDPYLDFKGKHYE